MSFTPAEIELMMEDTERHRAGTVQRTPDGYLRTYYSGFNLTALAEHICREMAQRERDRDVPFEAPTEEG